jgi:hypothetical protein
MLSWERRVLAVEQLGPVVRDRSEVEIQGTAQFGDGLGERVVKVAVAPVAEAVASHVDRRAKPAAVEQAGEVVALGVRQQWRADRKPVVVEVFSELVPGQMVDALRQRARAGEVLGGVGHDPLEDGRRRRCVRLPVQVAVAILDARTGVASTLRFFH